MTRADFVPTPARDRPAPPGLPGSRGIQVLVFAAGYIALAGVSHAAEGSAQAFTAVCLHAGLFLGVLLRTAPRDWPAFAAVALFTGTAFDVWLGRSLLLSAALSASAVLEGVLGAGLILRGVTRAPQAPTPRALAAMLLLAPGLATGVGGLVATGAMALAGQPQGLALTWFTWWSGDALGILLVTPPVLVFGTPLPHRDLRLRLHPLEPVLFVLAAWAWTAMVFTRFWHPQLGLRYTLVPVAMWAGFRLGIRWATAVNMGVALIAMGLTGRLGDAAAVPLSPLAKAAALQAFLFVNTASALFSSTVVLQQLAVGAHLKATGERLRAVFDGARDAIFIADAATGLIIDANNAGAALVGRPREELLGLHQSDLHPPAERDAYRELFRRGRGAGRDYHVPAAVHTARGDTIPVEISSSAITLDDGRRAIVGVFRDLTDRQLAEEQSQTILRTSMDGFCVVGSDTRVLAVNDSMSQITGYTRNELLSMRIADLEAAETGDDTAVRVARLVEAGHDRFETRHRRKDGRLIDVEISATTLAGGNQLCAFVRDITERKRADTRLQQSRAELQAIYDHAPVMMCVLDADRHVRYVNRALERFIGGPRPESDPGRAGEILGCLNAGTDPRGCGHSPECGSCVLRRALDETLEKGISLSAIECRATVVRDGRNEDVALVASTARLATPESPLLLLCLVDVTRERRADAALVASRNQLRALSRRLVALREDTSRLVARELHDRVGQNLTALNLNFTRLREALAPALHDRAVEAPLDDSFRLLSETMGHVRDVMAELRPPLLEDYGLPAALRWYGAQVARRTGLTVSVGGEFDGRLPADVETVLFRIAQEAISNTVRHASATGVAVSLQQLDDAVRVEVRDDGAGFDASDPPSTGRWGLLTMRERVESVGGTLTVSSAPGEGTSVTADVPCAGPAPAAAMPGEATP